jgi:hypothetical protein
MPLTRLRGVVSRLQTPECDSKFAFVRVLVLQTVLLDEYAVRVSPSDVRFNYVKFCSELQPMGPMPEGGLNAEELPRDKRSTSPLVVQKLDPEEDKMVSDVMDRVASNLRNRRSTFRQCFEDFDRTTKTRSGTTPNNFTISPGTITRTQFRQVLKPQPRPLNPNP